MFVKSAHSFRVARHPLIVLCLALCLAGGPAIAGIPQLAIPVMAQTTNQTYDCGTYGAGNYGSNDCLATAATPTPTPSPVSTAATQSGSLPGTGAQLIWLGVIGLALILGGIGLSWRRQRRTPSSIH